MDFRVFTLNCWGIAYVSKNRKQRMKAIAELLATSQYDVVCLQEVWMNSDFNLIKEKVQGVLPYSHYFHSGVTGSGVCILSKHPIDYVFFHQWPINGYIHKLHHGDWFGGKGVGLCRLKVQEYVVNVYSAHLHAEYDRDCDEYQAHRVLQAFDTAQFIQLTSAEADLVVLAGDLNTEPGDLAYRILATAANLQDSFALANEHIQQKSVATCDSLKNSYTPSGLLKNQTPGKRIDYIMFRSGAKLHIDLKSYQLPLPDKVPQCEFSYSDHEAVSAVLHLQAQALNCPVLDLAVKKSVFQESISVCDEALKSLEKHRLSYFIFALLFFFLLILMFVFNYSTGWVIVYHIFKLCVSICILYALLMATIWNNIESNAIFAAKLAMQVCLDRLKDSQ